MTNKSVQMAWRSRLTVTVGLGLTVAAAACGGGASSATSPSGVTPSSLAADNGQDTRNFSVTVEPISVQVGAATLHVTVTRDDMSGKNQQLGSAEVYVPGAFTIQSVSSISNANWTSGISGQTVRVGAVGGNRKLDGTAGRISVTFDINVTSSLCDTYLFNATRASSAAYADSFDSNWTDIGNALSVTVTGCAPIVPAECKAAPAVANAYLKSIGIEGNRGETIISDVADHMTQGARFDGIEPCDVAAYRAAVITFVIARLPVS